MHSFSRENQLVILACAPSPDCALLRNAILAITDWEKATTKLIKKGVAPLFLQLLEQNKQNWNDEKLVPEWVMAKLKQAYLKTVSRSMLIFDTFRDIAIALNNQNINTVALKGIYLAEHLYPKIGMRQFSDIDLLCREEEVEAALKIFEALGFKIMAPAFGEAVSTVMESAHLPPLIRNGVSVELHTRLHGPTQSYRLPEREMFQRAERTTINGQPFLVFGLHDLLIHLCLHLEKHFNSSHMQFYSWADIARLVSQRGHEIDAPEFWQRCQEYNAHNEVKKILHLVHELFGVKMPEELIRPLYLTNDMKGIIGVKEMDNVPDITVNQNIKGIKDMNSMQDNNSIQDSNSMQDINYVQKTQPKVNSNNFFDPEIPDAVLLQLEKHLNDRVSHESATQTHLFFIRKIKSPIGKLNYLREVLFPGKRVMKRAYGLKNDRWFWLWYPYRFWVGFKGLFWKKK